jgi:hypothetical protein
VPEDSGVPRAGLIGQIWTGRFGELIRKSRHLLAQIGPELLDFATCFDAPASRLKRVR